MDKFYDESIYLVVKSEERLVAMLAMRDKRPFSLDVKVRHLDSYLPCCERSVEVRLLAVEPEYRGTMVFRMLMDKMEELVRSCG